MTTYIDSLLDVPPRSDEALERVRPRMAALQHDDILDINLEPFVSASTVRGALPGLLALRADMVTRLNDFDILNLDLLETYALALLAAEGIYRAVTAKPERLEVAKKEGFELRAQLVAHCKLLEQRGLLPGQWSSALTVPNGYRNIGSDLLVLARLLRKNWPKIINRTSIEPADIVRAEALAEELLWGLASRQQRTQAAIVAADDRRRVYTLMINAYTEVRDAVVYLRRRIRDADAIVPSLYKKHERRRRKSRDSADEPEATGAVREPLVSDNVSSNEQPKGSIEPNVSRDVDDPFIR